MRMPSLSEWSCSASSDIGTSVSVCALTRSAIFSITPPSPALRTPYGSSVMMMALLPPRSCSMCARPRTVMRPRPDRYASRMPRRRAMGPPGGAAGPLAGVLHQPLVGDGRILEQRVDRVDDRTEVVGLNGRRHSDGDAGGAVDQQVGE